MITWSPQDEVELDLSAGTLQVGFFRMSRFRKKRLPDAVRAWRMLQHILPRSEIWLVAGPARILFPLADSSVAPMRDSDVLTHRHGEPWVVGFFKRECIIGLPAGELTRGSEVALIAVEPEANLDRSFVAAESPDTLQGIALPRVAISGDGNEVQISMSLEPLLDLVHDTGLQTPDVEP